MNVNDINYGLIVIDPKQEGDNYDILHFCEYEDKPTINEINYLKQELKEDEEFGLTEIWDRIEILSAPKHIVEKYKEILKDLQEND